jgi:hypothetical protein
VRGLLALTCLALTACFSVDLGNGVIHCGSGGLCPSGYYCHHDGRCWKTPERPGTIDLAITSPRDLAGVTGPDLAGADLSRCTAAICQPLQCGIIADPCTGSIDCGMTCPMGMSCRGGGVPNVCGCPTEQYCTGRNCGTILDGCGGVTVCGTSCPTGQTCGAGNHPNICGTGAMCNAKVCQANHDCGLISDGCSAVLNCGGCPKGHTCVGNGTCN